MGGIDEGECECEHQPILEADDVAPPKHAAARAVMMTERLRSLLSAVCVFLHAISVTAVARRSARSAALDALRGPIARSATTSIDA